MRAGRRPYKTLPVSKNGPIRSHRREPLEQRAAHPEGDVVSHRGRSGVENRELKEA